ncbi:preprotein translocase subunit SecG [Halorhodospira neutriphila]|uniref:Protein-export membrane protein SecG n=1 Tax=Halorhodospira neutriphila TaxID=168379 RepID=A0ABS1E6U0_9GAMM|nr:preprotein translocase subunit SecG [Halorhodospira neutriphila]MBK1726116.1 preprotein translocase subunit SecG [Halorhodospira neutriphila]
MFQALLVVHILIAIALVTLVMLNQGKGADMGAAFGSGASSTVFGSRGAATFMTKLIASLGTGFFLTSLGLAVIASQGQGEGESVVDEVPQGGQQQGPAAPEGQQPQAPPDAPEPPGGGEAPASPGAPAPPPEPEGQQGEG